MTDIVLVQASRVLSNVDVIAALPSLTKWARLVTDSYALPPVSFSFMQLADFLAGKASGAWPLFLNNHSTDPSALGFHDLQTGTPFGRSFSGDDIRDGISPWVTASHEGGEMIRDPGINSYITLRDGSVCLAEICDAVEDDIQAIVIDNHPWSNFVLPTYWQDNVAHPPGTKFDYRGRLSGPCPTLSPGGYMSLYNNGQWHQITAMRIGGRPSVRSVRFHHSHRRMAMTAASPGSTQP